MGRRARTLAGVAVALGGLATAAALWGGAVTTRVARSVVVPPRRRVQDTRVLSYDSEASTVSLSVTQDSLLPGHYSFWFDQGKGHARLGEIVDRGLGSVTREVLAVDFGDLATAGTGRFSGWLYLSPKELGVPFEEVRVQTSLGAAPAWLVPAPDPSTRWVIQVHGRATLRQETIRAIPVFRDAGYNSLLISYRNDGEAPPSEDRRYALGDREWLDVEAAMLFALDRGAEEIVLMGWSMGGATVLQAVTRSRLRSVITGVVLESPVVNWVETLLYQGEGMSLPGPVKSGVLTLLSSRWARPLTGQAHPIDLARLDFVARAGELDVPVLVLHSDDDGYVPSNGSRELAAARPDLVTFVGFETARHTKLWNFDRERWESSIAAWLAERAAAAGADDEAQPAA
ncbi:alpha/beta fold hydrolase [Naasia sp. SYSU D00948]|uniref:alpha/beta hydrolase family protein n=1 Tax=Naasia sp. SYSU D00948 TaxID=2817379 RepID=UPI0027DD686E|nr:alpha/beta fold hydrolase [Naasia sp. SYSU D00948]